MNRLLVAFGSLALLAILVGTAAAAAPADPVAAALAGLNARPELAQTGPGQELVVRDVLVDPDGTTHVRFDRRYAGLRVIGGDLVTHASAAGELLSVSGTLRRSPAIGFDGRVPAGAAAQVAEMRVAGVRGGPASVESVIYAGSGEPVLAYEATVSGTAPDGGPTELHVVVDATYGAVLDEWDAIMHADTAATTGRGYFSGNVGLTTQIVSTGFRLVDPSRGGGITCDMLNRSSNCYYMDDADNLWGDGTLSNRQTVAVDAQYGTAMTWDYYKTMFSRNGIGNDGKGASNRVHYGRNYNNAFWSDSCLCMTYGDGDGKTFNPFDSLDVAGHEMTHGVTSRTANLRYSGESGGLNEATSDIFGSMVEYYANNSNDAPDYKIGEMLYRNNNNGSKALRFMYDPALDGRSAGCWSSSVASLDVHYSSGVANHFYYLLAEGSNGNPKSPTCDGSSVSGIGRDSAAQIWYRALTRYMTSSTNYAGARTATLNAAADLYGNGSAKYNAVAAAWTAVNVR